MKKITLFVITLMLVLAVVPASAQQSTTVTLLHFSDYHSHAAPFYSEKQHNSAGIARAIAYLKPFADDPHALIFSGGDMINRGSPAWSDKYQCAEWPWLNGIVDAMAFGNHDADYGPEVFAQCRAQIAYPILSSNTLDAGGQPLFQYEGQTYAVFEVGGVKIGVFAVAGDEFERLVKPEYRPAEGATFADRVQTAQQVVKALRDEEQVNAVVLIGHALYEEDVALARAVPGIDVIFGTHSHRKEELTPIPGTDTSIISPYQYLTYVSKVELTFTDGVLSAVGGELVRMQSYLPEDPEIAQKVTEMQADLEADPQYAPLFQPIGEAAYELSTEGLLTGESVLGNFVMDIIRSAAGAHAALSTSSSFRSPIPPGTILEEDLKTALPYKNSILVYDVSGALLEELLNHSISLSGSDSFSQVSGARFKIADSQATDLQVLKDPADPAAGYAPLDPAATYKVATTNYQGLIAGGYKDIFAQATYVETGLDVWDLVRSFIQANSPVAGQLDGRIASALVPTPVPPTSELFPEGTYVLQEERVIGPYAVRLWRNTSEDDFGFPFDNIATISALEQPTVQIENATGLDDLTGTDITGEGHPDVIVERYTGGAHCCSSTVIYDLGPKMSKVLEAPESNCGGTLQDLDGDGVYEFVTCDDLFAYVYCCYAGSPAARVILQYDGESYVPASPSFPEAYEEDIARDREMAEGASPGENCEWGNDTKCQMLPLVLDYLYSGEVDKAWSEFDRLYDYPDAALFRSEIEQMVSDSPLFASVGPMPPNPAAPPYYMLQLLTQCDLEVEDEFNLPLIGLLTEGQSACDPQVSRREVFWLQSRLSQIGLLNQDEGLLIAPEGCTTDCRLDVMSYKDNARVGSIRLDTTVGFPGQVYRVNGDESAHWRLKGDLTWEMK